MDLSENATLAPLKWTQEHRASLDFAQGFVNYQVRLLRPHVDLLYEGLKQEWVASEGSEPTGPDQIAEIMDDQVLVRFLRFFRRKSQELKWRHQLAFVESCADDLVTWIDGLNDKFLGKLELDPKIELPEYMSKGFHHQPDGYLGSKLSGLMYDLGLDISFPDLPSESLVSEIEPTRYKKILDLGCGTGRSAEALVKRFPDAEIWGIDPSEPMLRVACQRAAFRELKINYRQALGENTRFLSSTFDLVSATILFHELPTGATEEVLKEAYRILVPGGMLVIGDELPFEYMNPYEEWYDRWQTIHNNEPYWEDFKTRGLVDYCESVGFEAVDVKAQGKLRFFGEPRTSWPPFVLFARKN